MDVVESKVERMLQRVVVVQFRYPVVLTAISINPDRLHIAAMPRGLGS
jgi:hypothetical protein